jgi:hypothetical protein
MLAKVFSMPKQSTGETCNRISLRLLGIIMLLAVVGVPAFSQTDYSDTWINDSNPDAIYIVGAGVTDDDYSADAIAVETTFTSPNGRTASGQGSDYASVRVEITLPWDWDDLGDYFIRTTHQPLCWGNWDGSMIYEVRAGGQYYWHWNPDYYRCMESRETSLVAKAGASRASYSLTSQSFCCCHYRIFPNCYVRCGPPDVIRVQASACAAYIQRIQSWYEA